MNFIRKHKKLCILVSALCLTLALGTVIFASVYDMYHKVAALIALEENEKLTDNGVNFDSRVEFNREKIRGVLANERYYQYEDCILAIIQVCNETELDANDVNDKTSTYQLPDKCMNAMSITEGTKFFVSLVEKADEELTKLGLTDDLMSVNNTKYLDIIYEAFIINDAEYITYALQNGGYSYYSIKDYLLSKDRIEDSKDASITLFANYVDNYTIFRRTGLYDFVYPVSTPIVIYNFNPTDEMFPTQGIIYKCTEKQSINSIGNGIITQKTIDDTTGYASLVIDYGDYLAEYYNIQNCNKKKEDSVYRNEKLGESTYNAMLGSYSLEIRVMSSATELYINPKELFAVADAKRKYYTDTQVAVGQLIADRAYQIYCETKKPEVGYTYENGYTAENINNNFKSENYQNTYLYNVSKMTRFNFIENVFTFYASRDYWKNQLMVDLDEVSNDDAAVLTETLKNYDVSYSASDPSDEYILLGNLLQKAISSNFYKSASCYIFDDSRFMGYNDICCILYPGDIVVYEAKEEDKEDDPAAYNVNNQSGTQYVYGIFLGNKMLYNNDIGNFYFGSGEYANYQVIMPIKGKNGQADSLQIMRIDDYGTPVKVIRFLGKDMTEEEYFKYVDGK